MNLQNKELMCLTQLTEAITIEEVDHLQCQLNEFWGKATPTYLRLSKYCVEKVTLLRELKQQASIKAGTPVRVVQVESI